MSERKYKTGLVLSGGGTRGFAHLGVIQALNEAGIFPDVISGTSAGALVGVLYADGYSPQEILEMTNSSSRLDFMRPAMPREGLLQISGVVKILKTYLRAASFEELRIPLFVAATDMNNGRSHYFSKGELINPVIASSSIPVLFQPVVINNICYLDGGVLDNMPVSPLENKCDYIIGSYVNPVSYIEKLSGLINIAERAFMLRMSEEINEKSDKFDLLVAPQELMNYKILDPEKAHELYTLGYNATKVKLETIDLGKVLLNS
jgi:NTE family protein